MGAGPYDHIAKVIRMPEEGRMTHTRKNKRGQKEPGAGPIRGGSGERHTAGRRPPPVCWEYTDADWVKDYNPTPAEAAKEWTVYTCRGYAGLVKNLQPA